MKNILIVCGGKSAEHEVSIMSARNIVAALDPRKFNPVLVAVSRTGSWHAIEGNVVEPLEKNELCCLLRKLDQTVLLLASGKEIPLDVAFPLIHGPMGEDGTLQGLLELMELPYVGSGVLASAVGMDKDLLKRLLASANIPVAPFITSSSLATCPSYEDVKRKFDTPIFFVKPAVMGSSVGIHKVNSAESYEFAVQQAFKYGFKILVEKFIPCRELECSVLGNLSPIASCVGEIKPNHEFYSYEAKYLDPNGAEFIVPANLSSEILERTRLLAIQSFQAIECRGLARVDFFLTHDDVIYVNELNTIPGFTAISMYPKLWEASGINYRELISQLILLAIEEYEAKQKIELRPDALLLTTKQKLAESA